MASEIPGWLKQLADEDLQFIRRFVLSSGSLKELAKQYSVSYPTLRGRLNQLIARIEAIEDPKPADELEKKVRMLVIDGKLSARDGKSLIKSHKDSMKKKGR